MMSAASGSRIVVIGGGSGFVGTALKNALQSKGYDPIIISRQTREKSMTWNKLIDSGLPDGTHAVINVAGQNVLDPTKFWTEGFKQNVYASRVKTTQYLADAIKKADTKPKVFVAMSGVGFYAPSDSAVYDETSAGGDFDFLSRLCTEWEKAALLPQEINVRTASIRSGVVLGSSGGMLKELKWPFFFGLGGPIGSGQQYMPWIHIKDLVNLFIYCIENDSAKGIVNGVAPEIITNKQFASAYGSALCRPAFIPLPTFVVNLLFSPERAKIMTEGQKVVPKKAEELGFKYEYPSIDLACKEAVSSG